MSDMWVDPLNDPREEEGVTRGERDTLLAYLDHYRKTLVMSVRASRPSSSPPGRSHRPP